MGALDTMLRLPGQERSFRCECGGNVFHKITDPERPGVLLYECNSCAVWYIAEELPNVQHREKVEPKGRAVP